LSAQVVAIKEIPLAGKNPESERKASCCCCTAGWRRVALAARAHRLPVAQLRDFRSEGELLGECNHRNIARLFGTCVDGPHGFLIMEFCAGATAACAAHARCRLPPVTPHLHLNLLAWLTAAVHPPCGSRHA
jgi:hypothetical protein